VDSLYSHPTLYAHVNDGRTHDLPHYLAMAAAIDGEVLELGAGTGRVTLNLARAGCRVVAVERDPNMCSLLKEKLRYEPDEVRRRVNVIVADATTLALPRTFSLAMCVYNGIAHQTTPSDLSAFLERTEAHLTNGGVFAFDTRLPNPQLMAGASGYVPWFRHPKYGDVCRAEETTHYDTSTQVLEITMTITAVESEREPERTRLEMRMCSQEQWHEELCLLGWDVLTSDVVGEDVYWTCRKAAGASSASISAAD
jgi:SAM-dependent methyltransferase